MMPPGLISHSCFALLLSDISAVYFRIMARRLYVFCKVQYESDWMYDIHSNIYVSINKVCNTNLISPSPCQSSSKCPANKHSYTRILKRITRYASILFLLFTADLQRLHIFTLENMQLLIYTVTHSCLREIVEPKSMKKYEYMRRTVGTMIHQSCLTVISSRSALSVVSAEVSVKDSESASCRSSSTVLKNQINRHKDIKKETWQFSQS